MAASGLPFRSPFGKRPTTELSSALEARLCGYTTAEAGATSSGSLNALAAAAIGAVGMGCLLLPENAGAQIVYTPANTPFKPICHSFQIECVGSLQIDFNHDGVPDASLRVLTQFATTPFSGYLSAKGLGSNGEVLVAKVNPGSGTGFCFRGTFAAAGRLVQQIGPGGKFEPRIAMPSYRYGSGSFASCGPWRKVSGDYLGFKFSINGKTHYGWARFNMSKFRGTLTGYAYEVTPNTAIGAGIEREAISDLVKPDDATTARTNPDGAANPQPAPATLGALAGGASGLTMWRPAR